MGFLDGLLGNAIALCWVAIKLKVHSTPRATEGRVETYSCKSPCCCCSKMAAWK
jgi:hypothetical protein